MSDVQANGLVEFQQVALDLWKADQQVFGASQKSAKELGSALAKVQAGMHYGDYTKWLKRNAIDRNRANYCVRVANGNAAKTKKPREPRFVLDGLAEGTVDFLKRFASEKGVSVAKYVVDVLSAHVSELADTPEGRAAATAANCEARIKRLQRIPQLGSETIHASDWKERTVERCRRLLVVAKPPRAEGLAGFFRLFEQVYGGDRLPLKWLLRTCEYPKDIAAHPDWPHHKPLLAFYGRGISEYTLPAEYSDAHETERILILEEEQQRDDELQKPTRYKGPSTSSLWRTFPDDEPLFYVRAHKKQLAVVAAENALAAKVEREGAAAKNARKVLDFMARRKQPATLNDMVWGVGRLPYIKRLTTKLAKDGELILREGVFTLPSPPAQEELCPSAP